MLYASDYQSFAESAAQDESQRIDALCENPRRHLSELLSLYEEGQLGLEQTFHLFQYLVDSGLAWTLQGSYGRTAHTFIQQGVVVPTPATLS